MSKHVCVLTGDGIGPEVTEQAVRVLKAILPDTVLAYELIGGAAFDAAGTPLPQQTIHRCKESDAVLLGAVGGAEWDLLPAALRPEAGLLGIRAALELYANLRPAMIFPALKEACPLKDSIIQSGIDLLVVRELTGDVYFGEKSRSTQNKLAVASDLMIYREDEVERIAKTAFSLALGRRCRVTSVDKANVLETSRLWRETVTRVAKDYPQVALNHMYVDNAAMQLVKNPAQFDVILTGNLFGDILSDEAAMISGSIGMLPSASLGKNAPGLYEPIHGSAPDIAGRCIANPLAAILSVAMMLRYSFRMPVQARQVERAAEACLDFGRTPDLQCAGLPALTTGQVGDFVVKMITMGDS